jgi:hypothetical protein
LFITADAPCFPSGDNVDAGAGVDLGGDADMLLALADDDAGGMPDFATSTYAANRSDRRKRKKKKEKRKFTFLRAVVRWRWRLGLRRRIHCHHIDDHSFSASRMIGALARRGRVCTALQELCSSIYDHGRRVVHTRNRVHYVLE